MRITRLVELSLFYKVRQLFSIEKTGEVVTSTEFKTYKIKYDDIDTSHSVNVYVNNVLVTSGFRIDYINGLIIFSSAQTNTDIVKVDYWYCPINVYDEGKDPRDDSFAYPAIAIYEDTARTEPIELGTAIQERVVNWIFEVWSERGGERNDIVDYLVDWLQEGIPIINFNDGFPTNRDGSKNETFNQNNIITYAISDSINYSNDGSLDIGDKPKYLSHVYTSLRVNPL